MAYTERNPLYDVTITDSDGNIVNALLCNNRGAPDFKSFGMAQQPRSSLKIYSGDTRHSDREPPYRSIEQRDFSGGMGTEIHEEDKTRYDSGYHINALRPEQTLLGPEIRIATGMNKEERNWFGDFGGDIYRGNLHNDTQYISFKFTPSQNIDATHIVLMVGMDDNVSRPAYAYIYSDDGAGKPDAMLYETSNMSPINYSEQERRLAFTATASLTGSTVYHIVLYSLGTGSSNGPHFLCDASPAADTCYKSSDGSSWSSYDYGILFRLVEDNKEFTPFFFEHLGSTYCIKSFDDFVTNAPEVWMNGDRGTATAGTTTTLTETGAGWTADEWIGAICLLYSGAGSEARTRWREITDNTTEILTVSPAFDIVPDTDTRYAIVNTDSWQEISGHGMLGRVTDVLERGNIVYILRGDDHDTVHMYDDTFTPEGTDTADGWSGSFMTAAKDSYGIDKIFLAKQGFPPMMYKADPVWTDDGLSIKDLDFESSTGVPVAIVDYDFETDTGAWVNIGSPSDSERSTAQVYQGVYSWWFNGSVDEGIEQAISVNDGSIYKVSAYGMALNAGGGVKMMADSTQIGVTATRALEWTRMVGFFTASGSSVDLKFIATACGIHGCFYVDMVKMEKVAHNLQEIGDERVMNLLPYGPDQRLHVATTGGLYMENYGDYIRITPQEYGVAKDDRTGAAAVQHGLYLYYSMLDGIARFYDGRIDQVGQNLDPTGIDSAKVMALAAYMDTVYAAIEGESGSYSYINVYNGMGWHSVDRTPATDMRISGLYIQSVPGPFVDRLWYDRGGDIAWACLDQNPMSNSNYRYSPIGHMLLSDIYLEQRDVEKYWEKGKVTARSYDGDDINASNYAVCNFNEPALPPVVAIYTSSGSTTLGWTFRYLWDTYLQLRTDDTSETPRLDAFTVDLLEHLPAKWSYTMQVLLADEKTTHAGARANVSIDTDMTKLKNMVNDADVVTLNPPFGWVGNISVKMTGLEARPNELDTVSDLESAIVTLTCIDA